jgi:CBS domain-containing protein
MAKQVRELMKKDPIKLSGSAPVIDAARQMHDASVGAVIVEDSGKLVGIVTDRDITVRVVAQGKDPTKTQLAEICSNKLTTLSPDDGIDRAEQIMREKSVRRVPVVDKDNRPVGIVTLGDLAIAKDPRSLLGQISAAVANR